MSKKTWSVIAGLVCAQLSIPFAKAADKIDLERITPVPATEKIPVSDFFRPLLLQEPKLNRAGTHIAAIVTAAEDRHQLLVYELATQKIESVGAPGDRDLYEVRWLDDRRLAFQLAAKKMYGVALMAADVGSLTFAYPLLQYSGSSIIAVPPTDRLHPLVWNRYNSLENLAQHDMGVAVVNTDLKNAKFVDLLGASASMDRVFYAREQNDRHIVKTFPLPPGMGMRYVTDIDGKLDFCVTVTDGVESLFHWTGERWEKCRVNLEEIDLIGTGDRSGQLVVRGPRQEGKPRALQVMDGVSGQLGDVILQDVAYDFYGGGISDGWLYRDPVHHQIIGAIFERNGPHVSWFTEEYRVLQKILDSFFPKIVVRILGSDEQQKIFLVATFSDRQPVVYNWVNLETRKVGLIKRGAPWIEPERMLPMSLIKVKTRDGYTLDAYLTLPAGASKSNPPPLVVLSHGGPWARDTWGFNGEVQFLASRGYAVLQTNYRGSSGYAWKFPEADKWDFAKMHNDVTDATKLIIASGLIDRNRIAIMGGSFGGYLALSGVVNEPELYRCAVSIAGVFDWEQQIRDKKYDQYDSPVFAYLMRKLGDPKQNAQRFEAISPGRHADKIRVPVFVAGGKEDQTVEIQQSRNLISSLRKYNVPFESYIVAEEGHGMAHLDKEVELYSRIETFLSKNLLAQKAPTAP